MEKTYVHIGRAETLPLYFRQWRWVEFRRTMDTFEIDVQFYPQIEKFMEQLRSGTEREENIFYLEHVIFKTNNFT